MATLTMVEAQAAAELAKLLYHFLPGTFSSVTWPDVAARFCLEKYWPGGSKLPAITNLLRNTLDLHRDRFCDLIVAVIQEGIAYRIKKGNPVKREEIEQINKIILKLQFRIPELHDRGFLDGLPWSDEHGALGTSTPGFAVPEGEIEKLKRRFLTICGESDSRKRGFAFEAFLNDFFLVHGLDPHGSFKVAGEQFDGSFDWNGNTFLVEARWRKEPANAPTCSCFVVKLRRANGPEVSSSRSMASAISPRPRSRLGAKPI